MFKWLAKTFGFIFLSLLLALLSASFLWYGVSFMPHLKELHKISLRGNIATKAIADTFYPLAVAAKTKEGIRWYAMRQAYWTLGAGQRPVNNLVWHFNWALWYFASFLHLGEKEVFGIWVDCAYGCGEGLSKLTNNYYKKPLQQLTEREMAGLLAIVRSRDYRPGSEKSEKYINRLLEKVKSQRSFPP